MANPISSRFILFLILSCWILESEERTTERGGSTHQRSGGGLSTKEILVTVFGCLVLLLVLYHAYKFYLYVKEDEDENNSVDKEPGDIV